MTPSAVRRQELRMHTEAAFESGGAMRSDLIMAAIRSSATQDVVDALLSPTEGYYETFEQVRRRLSQEDRA
jgi:hypothetical protein